MTQNQGHPAAPILRELAEVAEWNPEPWREFEYYGALTKRWRVPDDLSDLMGPVQREAYAPGLVRRRKPRTKRIGNYDVPLPERRPLKRGTQYWVADPTAKRYRSRLHRCTTWVGNEHEYRLLRRDLIHLDPESAEIHGRALASLMQENKE